ncbi:hypothetical protein [Mycobacteroides abscessus]|uniref:hypothetical protein n=1 Tax=Mycobacteroides abscessus TaxID=36809 RepID=UPI0009A7B076|nr:hypothetical protein [Mycobacteroides abscessus]SKT46693.1 Uncharacterised protein [Mycobacteroides abscessus subsp. bolletii]
MRVVQNLDTEARLAAVLTTLSDIKEIAGSHEDPVERGYVVHRVTEELTQWLPSISFDSLSMIANAIVDNLCEVNLLPCEFEEDEPIGFEIVETHEFTVVPLHRG